MHLTHNSVISLIERYQKENTGKPIYKNGCCFGFTSAYMNAFLLGERERFYKRLDVLARYHDKPERLFQAIERVRNKLKREGDRADRAEADLSPDEQVLLEIPAFFEAVLLQQKPSHFEEVFEEDKVLNQDYLAHHEISSPLGMEKPVKLHESFHAETLDESQAYFDTLAETLKAYPDEKVGLKIFSDNHVLPMTFNAEKNGWEFFDINCLGRTRPANRPHFIPQNKISQFVREGLPYMGKPYSGARYSPHTLFCVNFIGDKENPALTQALQNLDVPEHGRDYYERQNGRKSSLLSFYVMQHNLEGVRKCIDKHVDLNQPDIEGMNPLLGALCLENTGAARLLIEAGTDVNHQNHHGVAPIHQAIISKNREMISLLLERGANLSIKASNGKNALMFAAEAGEEDVLRDIANVSPSTALHERDNRGNNALMLAVSKNNLEAVKDLIELGCEINHIDYQGMTALGHATLSGNKEMVELLLFNGGTNQMTVWGSVESLALRNKHPEIADVLKNHFLSIQQTMPHPIPEVDLELINNFERVRVLLKQYINHRKKEEHVERIATQLTGGCFKIFRPNAPKKQGMVKLDAAEKVLSLLAGRSVGFTEAETDALKEGRLGKLVKTEVLKLISTPQLEAQDPVQEENEDRRFGAGL